MGRRGRGYRARKEQDRIRKRLNTTQREKEQEHEEQTIKCNEQLSEDKEHEQLSEDNKQESEEQTRKCNEQLSEDKEHEQLSEDKEHAEQLSEDKKQESEEQTRKCDEQLSEDKEHKQLSEDNEQESEEQTRKCNEQFSEDKEHEQLSEDKEHEQLSEDKERKQLSEEQTRKSNEQLSEDKEHQQFIEDKEHRHLSEDNDQESEEQTRKCKEQLSEDKEHEQLSEDKEQASEEQTRKCNEQLSEDKEHEQLSEDKEHKQLSEDNEQESEEQTRKCNEQLSEDKEHEQLSEDKEQESERQTRKYNEQLSENKEQEHKEQTRKYNEELSEDKEQESEEQTRKYIEQFSEDKEHEQSSEDKEHEQFSENMEHEQLSEDKEQEHEERTRKYNEQSSEDKEHEQFSENKEHEQLSEDKEQESERQTRKYNEELSEDKERECEEQTRKYNEQLSENKEHEQLSEDKEQEQLSEDEEQQREEQTKRYNEQLRQNKEQKSGEQTRKYNEQLSEDKEHEQLSEDKAIVTGQEGNTWLNMYRIPRLKRTASTLNYNMFDESSCEQHKRLDRKELKRKRERERLAIKRVSLTDKEKRKYRERDKQAKQAKRKEHKERLQRNARESYMQRIKREDPDVRKKRNERESTAQKRKREDPDVRKKRNERESTAQKLKREDPDVRKKRNERESKAQKRRREDPDVRKKRNKRESTAQNSKREDPDVRKKRNERESTAQNSKREDPDVRKKRNERESTAQNSKREDPDVRKKRNERESTAQKRKREDPDVRKKRNKRESTAQNSKREDPDVRKKKNERESIAKKRKREDPDVSKKTNERESIAKKRKREDPDIRKKRNERESVAKKKKREPSSNVDKAVETFKREIQNGPTFICTICNRLLYRVSVKVFNKSAYEDMLYCSTNTLSNDGTEYVCLLCERSLKAHKLPPFALKNGLELDEIPHDIYQLNSLESMFISRRIPFMKILALPRGKQKAVHGCVVNVPIEPEQLVSVLPRLPSSESFITAKVKRKLKYRGHSYMSTIRPRKILNALHILKNQLHNPHYKDVLLNENWIEDGFESDPNLWESLVPSNEPTSENTSKDLSGGESDASDDDEGEDVRSKLSGIPFDSCIQPKDLLHDGILSMAPGEGKKPISFMHDNCAEELSFPQLFPTGKFGFSHARTSKLSLKKYFQSRLLNCDRRFAGNIDYIFFAQYRTEAKDIYDSISLSLRKGKQQHLTAGDLKSKVSDFARTDLGIHFMQKIRGSPAFFNKMFYDLLGMIRQLGPCTLFVTLSAADLKWTDTISMIAKQKGQQLSTEDIENMSWEEKCHFLRSDPVTAARHFNNRVSLFFKHILLNKHLNPLGEVEDYKYRIEFQQRGSPHVHMLVWVKDAPSIDTHQEADIVEYIDNTISCELPKNDIDLYNIIQTVQKHTHSIACKKHGKICRFEFPKPPSDKTLVFKPLEDKPTSAMQKIYSETLTSVYDQLTNVDENTTLQDVLGRAQVTETLYLKALHWIKTKHGQPAIVLKRKPESVNINNYNPTLIKSWEANLDVQFVTNVYSCIMYLASYVSKPEKTLGDVLQSVSKSSQNLGAKQSMRNVANKFLTHREISAQEAVYRLLSLPLTQGSREVLFLNTDMPEDRTRLFKPLEMLQTMEDDDDDVYMKNVLDRYTARPHQLEHVCFAEFAAHYRTSYKRSNSDDITGTQSSNDTGDKITLKDGQGIMMKRRVPAIIRTHQWSVKKEPEKYFHAQLLLYFPWRHETNDLLMETYQESYLSKLNTIDENRQHYEHRANEVAEVLEQIDEYGFNEDSWITVAPETGKARIEEEVEGVESVPSVHDAFDASTHNPDAGVVPYEYIPSTEDVSNSDWKGMVLSLNDSQYHLHQFMVTWATSFLLSHTGQQTKPFNIFLTGGAGVGKSFLVRTIVQTVKRLLQRESQINDVPILVCAPTGAAAYNVAGHTCHSLFHLPVRTRKDDDYIPLSRERLATMKETHGNVKLIIIDEISMVSADMLLTIHRRLCDIMTNEQPFGGVSILAVGDLLQLPPVAQKAVYSNPSDEMASIYGSLWKNNFKIVELTEIQRQKNDVVFAEVLNRIRIGKQTDSDIKLLQSRILTDASEDYQETCTHMFTINKLKNEHNSRMIKSLNQTIFKFNATDTKTDEQTKRIVSTSFEAEAGGLLLELDIAVGARVVLTKNIDVSDGLVNSAAGTVTGFIPSWTSEQNLETFKPKYILVRFDDERVGHKARLSSKGLLPEQTSTPVSTVEVPLYIGKRSSKVTCKRTQFPLALAWGLTIHKEQGKTENTAVISTHGNFCSGQFYTAVSRLSKISGLYFLGQVSESLIKVNRDSLQEVERMKQESLFPPCIPVTLLKSLELYLKIQLFNINSLKPHIACYLKDRHLQQHHVICIQETWLTKEDDTPELPSYNTVRQDHPKSVQRHEQGGLLMFIHQDFRLIDQYHVPESTIEYQMVILEHSKDVTLRMAVLSVYKNPRISLADFFPQFEILLRIIPHNILSYVMGDFNIDLRKKNQASKQLLYLTRYYGFHQLVQYPTHRRGGLLDLLFVNRHTQSDQLDLIPTYYSDHFVVSNAVPLQNLIFKTQ